MRCGSPPVRDPIPSEIFTRVFAANEPDKLEAGKTVKNTEPRSVLIECRVSGAQMRVILKHRRKCRVKLLKRKRTHKKLNGAPLLFKGALYRVIIY